MNIHILVQNASISISSKDNGTAAVNHTTTTDVCQTTDDSVSVRATTTNNNYTTTTTTDGGGGMSPMAVHFLAVGALFVAVLVLAAINAYLHFRSLVNHCVFASVVSVYFLLRGRFSTVCSSMSYFESLRILILASNNKKAVLPQGNRAMPQVFFSVEVRQQHSLQV